MSIHGNEIRFFIHGAEAVMGTIGNAEQALDAVQLMERTIKQQAESIALMEIGRTQLNADYEKLAQDNQHLSGIISEAKRSEGERDSDYKRGHDDAMTELRQESESRSRKLIEVLRYDAVLLCMKAGHAPFRFEPMCALSKRQAMLNYSTLLQDIAAMPYSGDTVGIIGTNTVTNRLIFVVECDHWTLAPAPC